MKIYFLEDNNLQELNNQFKSLYINTISKFEERIEIYKKDALEQIDKDLKYSDYLILIKELEDTIKDLRDPKFEKFFLKLGTETLEQIRYASVSKHTDKCVIRAVFDILFKYCIDIELKIPYLCCNNTSFKLLQLEILRDMRYKIYNPNISPFTLIPIRNLIQNLKI
jgi:hypothetical protein